ncbi:MAG: transglutaminase domain-containing protein, partial [Verrucomicrobiota bacterium]|nr:transglutaminase domain-containing protein [Verrucomicrobiota bacterium]
MHPIRFLDACLKAIVWCPPLRVPCRPNTLKHAHRTATGLVRGTYSKQAFGLSLLFLAGTSFAQSEPEFTEPGWFRSASGQTQVEIKSWAEISQAEEPVGLGGEVGLMSLPSYPEIAEAITPEIRSLARNLENDPVRIFNYVRDHIRYVHYFGSKKGAALTLLERSGNDFDQCALLVALLRAAGYTAGYRFGTVSIPYETIGGANPRYDLKHWLGLTKPNTNWIETIDFVAELNYQRGFPFTGVFTGLTNSVVFHHVWVRLSWSNGVYELDPSFKVQEPVAGIDLTAAMRLDTNQLLTAAGGTATPDYVQGLNEAALRNVLRDYTTNLLAYLQSHCPNCPVERVIGGMSIASGQYFGGPLPFTPVVWNPNSPTVDWDNIPTNLMASLRITVDVTTNRFLFMPQLQGRKLALTFSTNGLAQLSLEDELLLQKQTTGGSRVSVELHVDHPHGRWDFARNQLIPAARNDHKTTVEYQRTNATYAILYAFMPHRDWLHARQRKLDHYRAAGLGDDSPQIVSETLNIMGLTWMLQTEYMSRLVAAQQNVLLHRHHRLGRMAQEFGKGHYIDVYQQLSCDFPTSGNGTNDMARCERLGEASDYLDSAAEHGLIEQLQSSNLVAASTVKMLQIANTNGQRIYLLHSGNWAAQQGNLINYNKSWLKTNYIDQGYTLLLPANGANQVAGAGSWAGYGIVARGIVTNEQRVLKLMAMLIDGGYYGGYSAYAVPPNIGYLGSWNYLSLPSYFQATPPTIAPIYTTDPVNMADGAFHLSAAELALGGAEPRGINFSAQYSSSRRNHNLAGLANGWIHNYHIRAVDVSAPWPSLGDTTPAQMAPLIVATRAAAELYSTTPNPKNWAVTALIAKWGVDQMINNAVSITLGKDTLQFIKQPNGTFTPPAGSTHTLLRTNNTYWLLERHGRTFKFNHLGLLTNITDPYNRSLRISYGTGPTSNLVTQVTDWTNRTLTFAYSGNRLNSVTDNTGRSVVFGYTTNAGRVYLTSIRDPEGKTNRYVYDANHQIIATFDALGRMVVSNVYDGFGRVVTQYTAGDPTKMWVLYWSGYENVEQDPEGNKRRFFYDDKHRLVALRDALGNLTRTFYDGQDHVVMTVSPLNETNRFEYDGYHNLLRAIDPLGHTNRFFYDAQHRLVRTVDTRGFTNYFGYNAQHSLTGQTNAAGDWVRFEYNTDGTLRHRIDPAGTNSYFYDSWGQLARVVFPAGLGTNSYLNNALGD